MIFFYRLQPCFQGGYFLPQVVNIWIFYDLSLLQCRPLLHTFLTPICKRFFNPNAQWQLYIPVAPGLLIHLGKIKAILRVPRSNMIDSRVESRRAEEIIDALVIAERDELPVVQERAFPAKREVPHPRSIVIHGQAS